MNNLAIKKQKTVKFGLAEWFLTGGMLFAVLVSYLIFSVPTISDFIEIVWDKVVEYSYDLGYLGAFFMSWLGNSTIVIPFPYTALVFLFGASGLNPMALGILAGVGATLGESISYIVGFLGYKVTKDKYRKNMSALRKLIDTRPKFAIFFFFLIGATPIPDDVFIIPLGLIRYNVFRAIIPFAIGKIVLTSIIAYMGYFAGDATTIGFLEDQREWVNVMSLVGVIIVIYAILKINWEKLSERLIKDTGSQQS